MTMYASAWAASATSAIVSSVGARGRLSSSTPIASPRLVTGANSRNSPSASSISTVWCFSESPCGLPASGTRSAVSRPCVRVAPATPA